MAASAQALAEMFPGLADQIRRATESGFSDADIESSVGRLVTNIRRTASPQQTSEMLGARITPPEHASIPERIKQSVIRGVTFGLAGKPYDVPEDESLLSSLLIEEIPGLVASIPAFGPLGKLARLTGLPAKAVSAVPTAGRATQKAVELAVENALIGGGLTAGQGVKRRISEQRAALETGAPLPPLDPLGLLKETAIGAAGGGLLGGTVGAVAGRATDRAIMAGQERLAKQATERASSIRWGEAAADAEARANRVLEALRMPEDSELGIWKAPEDAMGLRPEAPKADFTFTVADLRATLKPYIEPKAPQAPETLFMPRPGEAPTAGVPGEPTGVAIQPPVPGVGTVPPPFYTSPEGEALRAAMETPLGPQPTVGRGGVTLPGFEPVPRPRPDPVVERWIDELATTSTDPALDAARKRQAPLGSVRTPDEVFSPAQAAQDDLRASLATKDLEAALGRKPTPDEINRVLTDDAALNSVADVLISRGQRPATGMHLFADEVAITPEAPGVGAVPPVDLKPTLKKGQYVSPISEDPVAGGWTGDRIQALRDTAKGRGMDIGFNKRTGKWQLQDSQGARGPATTSLDEIEWQLMRENVVARVEADANRPLTPTDVAKTAAEVQAPPLTATAKEIAAALLESPGLMSDKAAQASLAIMRATNEAEISAAIKSAGADVGDVRKAVATQRARLDPSKVALRTNEKTFNIQLCASPCIDLPIKGVLSDEAAAQLYRDLEMIQSVQRPVAMEQEGLLYRLKNWATSLGRARFLTPDFVAEKDPAAAKLNNILMAADRNIDNYHFKTSTELKSVKFSAASDEAFTLGAILNNPEARTNPDFLKKLPVEMRAATREAIDYLENRATMLRLPPEKYISNYFRHMFDRKTLFTEAERLEKMLLEGTLPNDVSPADAAAVVDSARKIKADILNGVEVTYQNLPMTLKNSILMTRRGALGYGLDAVKVLENYDRYVVRKVFLEPALQEGNGLLKQIADPELRAYMARYLRDYMRLGDRPVPDGVNTLASLVRNFEYIRTIGLFNFGTAIRNISGQLLTAAEVGPKAFFQGANLILDAAKNPDSWLNHYYAAQGHAQSIPIWYARKASIVGDRPQKILEAGSGLFNMIERGNRRMAWFGGIAKWFDSEGAAQGLSLENAVTQQRLPDEAIDFANRIVTKTQFHYGPANRPLVFQSPVVSAAFQFMPYTINAAELMWRWAAREGAAGRMKLAGLAAMGLGLAEIGDLAGVDLGKVIGVPMDFLSAVRTLQSATNEDWDGVRKHAAKLAVSPLSDTRLGPAATGLARAKDIIDTVRTDAPAMKKVEQFVTRDLLPTQINKIWQSYQAFESGAPPEELVTLLLGFPNGDLRVRMAYLNLLQNGDNKQANLLLQKYKELRGGTIPLDVANVSQLQAERRKEVLRRRVEAYQATPAAKLRKALPEGIEDLLL